MPDITLCTGEGCDRKDRCFRYLAAPNPYYQSYMEPLVGEDRVVCFAPVGGDDERF